MRLCVRWVEIFQTRDGVCNALHAYKGLQATDNAPPDGISTRKTLRAEEGWMEAQCTHDGAKNAVNLIVRIEAPSEIVSVTIAPYHCMKVGG